MKRYYILIAFLALILSVNAQKGKVKSATIDTVKGNEDITLAYPEFTGSDDYLTVDVVFAKISSAAGGTAYLQGSVDGTVYSTLTSTTDLFTFFPNDTVTVTDAGTMKCIIKGCPLNYYQWFIDGDVNDTVKITPKYVFK